MPLLKIKTTHRLGESYCKEQIFQISATCMQSTCSFNLAIQYFILSLNQKKTRAIFNRKKNFPPVPKFKKVEVVNLKTRRGQGYVSNLPVQ
jgi:hypothetical protein